MARSDNYRSGWNALQWILFAVWITAGALDMAHRRAGFLTDHAADLTLPAWLYVVFRTHRQSSTSAWRRPLANASPVILASGLFIASATTEVCQYFWPHGLFPGTFDPLDIAAYGAGIGICCFADLRWPIPPRGSPSAKEPE